MRIPSAITLSLVLALAASPAAAADGKALYGANCTSCHGADGSGDTPVGKAMNVPSLLTAKHAGEDPASIVKFVQGSDKHSAVAGKLSAEELEAIAGAVQSMAKASQD